MLTAVGMRHVCASCPACRWLLECAEAQRLLDEAAFALPPPAASQEQGAPNAAAAQPAASKGGASSMLAADTYQQQQQQRPRAEAHLPPATVAAAAARAARAPDPLRQSVNSRPISSLQRQPAAPSLHTQAPSVKRSVHWGADVSEGSAAGGGSAASAAAYAAAAAVLPTEVERAAVRHDDAGGACSAVQLWSWTRVAGRLPAVCPALHFAHPPSVLTAVLLQRRRPTTAACP